MPGPFYLGERRKKKKSQLVLFIVKALWVGISLVGKKSTFQLALLPPLRMMSL